MPLNRITILFASAVLAAACTPITPQPEPVVIAPVKKLAPRILVIEPAEPDPAISTVGWWFDYYRNLREQPITAVTKEYKNVETAFSADKSLQNRLRLVSLLSLRDTSFHNPEHAVKLLDALNTQSPPLRNAAMVWRSNLLAELEDNKKIQALLDQVKEMQTANKEIQNTNKEMQHQLNALKEIERNLYERNKVEVINKR